MHLDRAHGLAVADLTGASDPFVFIQGAAHLPAKRTVCLYKSHVVNRSLDPVWSERCLLPGLSGFDDLVITVADHDLVSAPDFLGQV